MTDWTPGYGQPYFREPKFYTSPTVKDAKLKDDRVNVANAAHINYTRYYTNDEILDIWAKPLTGFQVTAEEKAKIEKDPTVVNSLVFKSDESPCYCHIKNMLLDKCQDMAVGQSNDTMLQDTSCNYHFYRLNRCVLKHYKWYEARREALRQALPEAYKARTEPLQQHTRFDVDPHEYYPEFKNETFK